MIANDYPVKINLGLHDGVCNLRCPKCFIFGENNQNHLETKFLKGEMSKEKILSILDELEGKNVNVQPAHWAEPLIAKTFDFFIIEAKKRNIQITINTNGLLIDEEKAQFLVDMEVDSIFISIDAFKEETFVKTRSTDELGKVKKAVFSLLEKRASKNLPRIGVSYTEDEINEAETEDFLNYWIEHVDAVRINATYTDDRHVVKDDISSSDRKPCKFLFDSMVINYNGDVPVCCLDTFNQTNMGNVFDNNVKEVWQGSDFEFVRKAQIDGDYDKIPFCKNCDIWASDHYNETTEGNLFIRRSAYMTYYNRIDRLDSWKNVKR